MPSSELAQVIVAVTGLVVAIATLVSSLRNGRAQAETHKLVNGALAQKSDAETSVAFERGRRGYSAKARAPRPAERRRPN